MDKALVNIVITTTYKRGSRALGCDNFVSKCIKSIIDNTTIPYRLIIVMDDNPDSMDYLDTYALDNMKEYILIIQPNQGIACAINAGWYHAEMLNKFYGDTKYFCYIQDDTVITKKGWLDILIKSYEEYEYGNEEEDSGEEDIGFFSGHDAPEHKSTHGCGWTEITKDRGIKFKKFLRATNLIGTTEFWRSMMPIPRNNPRGDPRGFPTPGKDGKRGRGSNIDVWLTGGNSAGFCDSDAGPNCCHNQGKICMVIPGLVKHVGNKAKDSTWFNENKEY